ncbi:TetR/AcrR family transcriptional regulator [Corynebacterium singulare]|uniref:WHG domain-containing protein n=1 Tax=Corynebacterium singulare TaxID=161899 RepID=A0ABS9PW85_9CORY|nr:TetR-like C-terminal domain-containing protein [Corynebacterium singulare]MCG7276855.1 WHG domain-containing protein [Corynebacterium singulare]
MKYLFADSPREAILEAAVHVAAAHGDDAVTVESVAKYAGLQPSDVTAVFSDRAEIVSAICEYLSQRKVSFLKETLETNPGYADLFTKLTTFTEAYYEYAEREPELFRYLFEQKACVLEDEWRTICEGKPSNNMALDLVYENMVAIAEHAGLEVGPDVCPPTLAKLSVASWATVHGMAHLSVLGVLRHQHSVVRRFNLREVSKALIGTLFQAAETCETPDMRAPMEVYRERLRQYDSGRDNIPDISAIEDLTALPADESRVAIMERAIQLAGKNGMHAVTIENVADYFNVSDVFVASLADNDFVLRERVEQETDRELESRILYLLDQLPEDAPAREKLLCIAVAYFAYAISEPERYSACIAAASGSVVPLSEDGEEQTQMGESFALLMRFTREALREAGHEPEDRLVYIKNFTLWAGADGMCHLASVGEFRTIDIEEKWSIYYAVVGIVFASFAYSLRS